MESLMEILPVMLYSLSIILVIVFIVLGIKLIGMIDKANDIDELTEIVEERAASDDSITNKEYCEIVEYANIKIKNWRHK